MKTNIEEEVEDVENSIGARKKLDLNGAAHGGEEGAIHRNRWKTRRRRCPHHHRPTQTPVLETRIARLLHKMTWKKWQPPSRRTAQPNEYRWLWNSRGTSIKVHFTSGRSWKIIMMGSFLFPLHLTGVIC
jgi:hypothetical protein